MNKKNMRKNKGGSIASNRVNAFTPNFTSSPCKFKVNNCMTSKVNNLSVKNYGSSFKTQGGKSKKKGGNNQYNTFKNYPVSSRIECNNTSNLYEEKYKYVPIKNDNVGGKKYRKTNKKTHKGSSRGPMDQRGDSNIITGAAVPKTWAQNIQNVWDGVTSVFTNKPSNPTYPSGLQLACDTNNCNVSENNSVTPQGINNKNGVYGFKNFNIEPTKGLTFPDTPEPEVIPKELPAPRAGGKRKTKKNKKTKRNKGGSNTSGPGSDFQSTLQSRGPYNYPDSTWHYSGEDGRQVALNNFRAFNKTSEYIPPSVLSNGAACMPPPPQVLRVDPTYNNPWFPSNNVYSYNDYRGVPTKSFNGAGRKKSKNII